MPAWPDTDAAEQWLSYGQGTAAVRGSVPEALAAAEALIREYLDDRLLPDQAGDVDDRCPAPVRTAILMLTSRLIARRDSPVGVVALGELAIEVSGTDRDVMRLIGPYMVPDIDGELTT